MKKVVLSALIAIIVVSTAFALVACNGNEDPNGGETPLPEITLVDTMTVDEVKAELAKVKTFTLAGEDDGVTQTIKVEIDKLLRWTYENKGVEYDFVFAGVVDNRLYAINFEENVYLFCDVKGLDIDFASVAKQFGYVEELIKSFNYDDYSIVDGTIVSDGGLVYKDFNKTVVELPANFDEYKAKESNIEAVEYTDIDENTCKISEFNIRFKSFTVPDTHNGKKVVGISADPMYIQNLTIGKNIEYVQSISGSYGYNNDMVVNYLGTKEEWGKITNSSTWNNRNFKIICSDGEIEK